MSHTEESNYKYVDRKVAATFLNLSPNTLDRWRSEKRYLSYYLIGGAVKYKMSDLVDFAESRRVSIAQ